MSGGEVRVAETEAGRADAMAVREAVFVDEQGVPVDRERDGKDGEAIHFVAYGPAREGEEGRPVGAARLRELDPDTAKVERVAVLADRRGEGWGRRIMDAVEATAAERGVDELVLHAQTDVEGFYHALDYETTSGEFEDAGIPHVEMRKRLDERGGG